MHQKRKAKDADGAEVLTIEEAADFLKVSPRQLNRLRFLRDDPVPSISVSPRLVRFLREDLVEWLRRNSKSESAASEARPIKEAVAKEIRRRRVVSRRAT